MPGRKNYPHNRYNWRERLSDTLLEPSQRVVDLKQGLLSAADCSSAAISEDSFYLSWMTDVLHLPSSHSSPSHLLSCPECRCPINIFNMLPEFLASLLSRKILATICSHGRITSWCVGRWGTAGWCLYLWGLVIRTHLLFCRWALDFKGGPTWCQMKAPVARNQSGDNDEV